MIGETIKLKDAMKVAQEIHTGEVISWFYQTKRVGNMYNK